MAQWVEVADVAKLEPGEKLDAAAGKLDLLVCNVGGQFYATSAECTHVGGPLPDGSLRGNVITCPWHGSRFDVKTGAVLEGPAEDPLRTFATKVENGKLMVEVPG